MSWCSEWIRDWLKQGKKKGKKRTQNDLAHLADIDAGNISRWLSGQSRPDPKALGTLTASLTDQESADLLIAWVKDMLPEGHEKLVHIYSLVSDAETGKSKGPTGKKQAPPAVDPGKFPLGVSDDLQEQLVYFSKLAVANPDVRKILDVCYDAVTRKTEE